MLQYVLVRHILKCTLKLFPAQTVWHIIAEKILVSYMSLNPASAELYCRRVPEASAVPPPPSILCPVGVGRKQKRTQWVRGKTQWGGGNHNWKRKKCYETIQSFVIFSPFQYLCATVFCNHWNTLISLLCVLRWVPSLFFPPPFPQAAFSRRKGTSVASASA